MNRSSARTFLAISLVSAATLTYEIGLTRIFSLSQGYHFAFMVISIALLGIGAGGAVMMIYGGRGGVTPPLRESKDISAFLATLSALFSIVSILSFIAANQIMFDPVKAAWSRPEFLKILAQYLILSLPFVISGMILSSVYKYMSDMVHRTYLADMAGAGAGCLLVLYIFSKSSGEGAVLVSAIISLIASFLFCVPSKTKGFITPVIAAALVALVAFIPNLLEIRMSPYRELASVLNFPGSKVVETMLSPSGKMDIVESPAVRAAPGISLTYQSPLPPQMGFTINGGGLSTVTGRKGDLSFLRHLPSSLPYRLRRGGDVFVIDPGGGMEVLSALENGARDVWGSETRGIVLSAMEGSLSSFSGGLYNELKIRHGYGRNVLKGSGRIFDVIQLPLTDTLGSSSSGIMGMQEEYNLTVEAFSEYIRHLKKDGFVSSSIYLLPPPRQELKLLSTLAEAMEITEDNPPASPFFKGGVSNIPPLAKGGEGGFPGKKAAERIIAIRSWGVLTILAKNGVINTSDIDTVKEFCRGGRFDLVWYPGMKEDEANIYNRFPEPLYHRLFRTILEGDKERFYKDYIFDVRPATDDRPFFGQTFKMTRMRETYEDVGKKWGILIEGGYLLPWILIQSVLASIILVMFPLIWWNRHLACHHRLEACATERVRVRERGISLLSITAYFSAIGIGFMFLEISIMQRMIPVLGEPVYAISAVLFTLLLSTGVGSYLSGRFRITERYSIHVLLMVPLLATIYLFIMGAATEKIAGMDIIMRFVLTFLLFFPLGIVMGIPFPTGMSILGGRMPELIPWAWCINGSFSVISSVLAMMAALTWGFSTVHILAAGCYVIAWLAVIPLKSSQPLEQRRPL